MFKIYNLDFAAIVTATDSLLTLTSFFLKLLLASCRFLHSLLNASTVVTLTALLAGINPASAPEIIRMVNAFSAMLISTSGLRNMPPLVPIAEETSSSNPTPSNQPEISGNRSKNNRLENNLETIAAGGAPMALRIPISLVRSFTTMSMMLLTPITPASSVPIPTIHTRALMPINNPCILPNSFSIFQ